MADFNFDLIDFKEKDLEKIDYEPKLMFINCWGVKILTGERFDLLNILISKYPETKIYFMNALGEIKDQLKTLENNKVKVLEK